MRKYSTNWRLWGRIVGFFYVPPFTCLAASTALHFIERGEIRENDVRLLVKIGLWAVAFAAATSWLLHAVIVVSGRDRRPRARQGPDRGDTPPTG